MVAPCRATCPQFGPVGREETHQESRAETDLLGLVWLGRISLPGCPMLRKVPACNNLRIFRKEIQENRCSNFGCVFIQAFRHCFFLTSELSSVVAVQCCLRPWNGRCFVGAVDPLKALLKKMTHGFWGGPFQQLLRADWKAASENEGHGNYRRFQLQEAYDALGCWRNFSDFDQAPRDVIS